ncbi:ATP-binding protein [Parapedobacter sp.]
MKRLLLKLACIVPMVVAMSGPLDAQIKDITALKARIPALRDSVEQVAIYARLGMLYSNRSLDSCYYFGARALDLAKRINDKAGEAEALNVLAFYYQEKANPYLAYKYINESLTIFKRLGNKPKICEVTMNIGVLLSYEGKLDQSLAQYRKAYELSGSLVQDSIRPLVLLNLALAQSFTPQPPDVTPLIDEAEGLAEKQGNQRFLIIARLARNATRFRSGIPAREIIPRQHAVIAETKEAGYEYFTALAYMELANMFLPMAVDSAIHYFDQAIELADRTGYEGLHFQTMAQAYQVLSQVQPLPVQANVYSRKLLELRRDKELENQKTGMDFLQLALKEQEVAADEARLRSRRTLGISLGVICLLAVGFSLLVFRLYRNKRRLAKRQREINARLEEQYKQLEDNNAFHQKLISIISHDLRQPLSSMLMLGEAGMVDQMSDSQRQYVFDQVSLNARTSLQAMDGLVHWMKLNTVGLAYTPSTVNLKEVILGALAYNQLVADQKGIVVMDFIPAAMDVLAQSEMLLFVNRNILSNALRHTPNGGRIVISVVKEEESNHAMVRVADSGSGIPPNLLPRLFDKEQSERATGGSGLALIICHEMIERMNGRIWATNNPEGGASFCYSLPLAAPPIVDAPPSPRISKNLNAID